MKMSDRNILNIYCKLATDEKSKEEIIDIVDLQLDEIKRDIKDLQEKLFWYEKLKEEIIKKEV